MTEAHNTRPTKSRQFGLTHDAIFRLLKAAIKDDEKLVDDVIAAVYDQMVSFDSTRAYRAISLIVRRHRGARDAFKALLSDLSKRHPEHLNLVSLEALDGKHLARLRLVGGKSQAGD
jgi:hypothetical protein